MGRRMIVGVAGAGAVGGHYAAMLASGGVPVRLLARGDHLAAIRRDGLMHRSPTAGERCLRLPASDDPAILADCDLVLLGCKTTQLDAMLASLAPVLRRGALVVTLQNGVDAPAAAAAALPGRPVVAGSAFIGARLDGPGRVVHTAAGGVALARWRGEPDGRLAWLAAAFARGAVPVAIEIDARRMLWRKMVWNCGFNAITALLGCEAHEAACDGDAARLAQAAMEETLRAAAGEGVHLPPGLPRAMIERTRGLLGVRTSMRQDLEAGRPTEIEAINGRVARSLGAGNAPVNTALAALVRARERLRAPSA